MIRPIIALLSCLLTFGCFASPPDEFPYKPVSMVSEEYFSFVDMEKQLSSSVASENNFEDVEYVEENQVLVVLFSMQGSNIYSKVVIHDVDLYHSLFIVKDMMNNLNPGLYRVMAAQDNGLIASCLFVKD